MPKLHEILAVESDVEGKYRKILEEAADSFKNKHHLFSASNVSYEPFDEDKRALESEIEYKEMSTTVDKKLAYMFKSVEKYLNVVYQKDTANQEANGDIKIGDVTVASNVPATFLLGLENKLKHVKNTLLNIPTLQPGISWISDTNKGEGVFVTEHPIKKFRTKKVTEHKILVPATKEHPAQVEKWNEDIKVGVRTDTQWSGTYKPARKSELLERIDAMIHAVKKARTRANQQEVKKADIAKSVIDYILDRS